jgi:uncharacterized protein YbaR (Trm112 family)
LYIELIDLLRCPVEHEETWLVASFSRVEDRFIIEGKLGCPVCSAMYEIVDGVPRFGPRALPSNPVEASDDDVVRAAALLNLTRPNSIAVLCGDETRVAAGVSEMTQARIIVLNPQSHIEETERVAAVTCENRIPLGSASVDAIAVGDCGALVGDAARVLRPGGRISAAASIDLGSGFVTLARDEKNVVGEAPSSVIQIGRR